MNQRIEHRALTSSRGAWLIACSIVLGLAAAYLIFEVALAALGYEPLLVPVNRWWQLLIDPLSLLVPGAATLLGALAFVIGLLFVLAAVTPGRRARLALPVEDPDAAIVVDYQVLAASLARRVRAAAGVGPGQVWVTVGARDIQVQLRPTSGLVPEVAAVEDAVRTELRRNGLASDSRIRVNVAGSGVVGQ